MARDMAAEAPELSALDAQLSARPRLPRCRHSVPGRLPDWGALIVHGGIPAAMDSFPDTAEEAARLTGAERDSSRKVLRTRYIEGGTGKFLALGRNQPGDPFWADVSAAASAMSSSATSHGWRAPPASGMRPASTRPPCMAAA
ncbi:MAG: hypothetical protein R3B98_04180 [Hyphomonas sp.]